ncbi:chemotaxis protein methyltransferase CheR [Plesiocystis pacifica SIR-1]|uniref:protein-glutamate O-methyltransferase n=1 Tax=Plesiocystis pacifica SIR-1 TaxID=391625 RepID=A6G727_9BACT|nr:protein-glutamate O-methyltransferase CheR [Plesiocystis pacifica]EDM78303.1 chemotaxis protein methyltransferase CheR [Plesiocystis pacifica SIR-1]
MNDEETRLLVEAIQEHCGVTLSVQSGFFLERRLNPRLVALGLSSYLDYYQYLRYDPAGAREMEELVECITTHETYFFREQYQLEAFSEEILPDLAERLKRSRRLTVWSAGCSTGEEVYTIAMLLLESGLFRGWNLRVAGSDISRKVLATARAAVYGQNSFRTTPPALRRKYFVEKDGRWVVRDDVRSMCSFGQLNLISTERFRVLGPCDVIFCRNVLMYLSQEARHRVVEAYYDRLTPGGYLLLGHSESLLNVTTRFDLATLQKDLVYRKPLTASPPSLR